MSLKVDLHVHSIASFDGRETLCRICDAAKNAGLDAVCVCDHNVFGLDRVIEMDGVWLLPGCEISTRSEHVIAFMCERSIDLEALNANGPASFEEAVDAIHAAGGLAILAHPFAHPSKKAWSFDQLRVMPDAVETANARAWMINKDANSRAAEAAGAVGARMCTANAAARMTESAAVARMCTANAAARMTESAAGAALPQTGGSDGHIYEEIGNAYTVIDCDRVEDIKAAIKDGKTTAVLVSNTKRVFKGRSQMTKAKRDGRSSKKLKAFCVYVKCVVLDFWGK